MPTVTTDTFLPFLVVLEQLKPSLNQDIHLLSRDEQLSAIDVMSDALLKIKYYLNAQLPVHRLPPELLTLVFEYASFRDPRYALRNAVRKAAHSATHPSEPAYGTLIPITHVCHVWRSAALAATHLWTHADIGHVERLDTFIDRSHPAPLSVTFSGPTAGNSYLQWLFECSGSRLQRLDIGHDRKLIPPRVEVDGSGLKCLTIATKLDGTAGRMDPRVKVFEQSISSLTSLALCLEGGYWVPSTPFPNLTHLLLGSCFGSSNHGGELLLHLTSMLAGTPRLRYLHLFALESDSSPPTLNIVSLPHLKLFLCTTCDPDTSLRLLSLLNLPTEAFVALDSSSQYYSILKVSEVFKLYQLPESGWMQSLTHLQVSLFRHGLQVVAEGHSSGFWLKSGRVELYRLLKMFPFGSVRTLDIFVEHNPYYPLRHQDDLQDVLDNMPSLVSLRIPMIFSRTTYPGNESISCCALDDNLKPLLPLMPGDGDAPIRCPLLTMLCIEAPPKQLEMLAPRISDFLAARAHAGVPLTSVTLRVPRRMYTLESPPEGLALDREPLRREVFDAAACYVKELNLEFDVDGPGELATRGTYWDVELSQEAEKYWITPDYMAPQWFRSSIEDLRS